MHEVLRNFKYGGKFHTVGNTIELTEEEAARLSSLGFVGAEGVAAEPVEPEGLEEPVEMIAPEAPVVEPVLNPDFEEVDPGAGDPLDSPANPDASNEPQQPSVEPPVAPSVAKPIKVSVQKLK